MKILHVAQYVYNDQYDEFRKNKSGLGIMVHDICEATSEFDEVYLLTHAITCGRRCGYNILKHTWRNVLSDFRISNLLYGLKQAVRAETSLKTRVKLVYYALNIGCMARCVKTLKPDVIHIHEYTPPMRGFVDYCIAHRLPVVVTCHGLLAEKDCEQYIKDSEVHMIDMYKAHRIPITTISRTIREKLIRYNQIADPGNIHVVLNGVKKLHCADHFAQGDSTVLLCVGQLSDRKNQLQIVRALALLDESTRSKLKVYFIGNDLLNGAVQKFISDMQLEDTIVCAGFVQRDQLQKYYEIADGLIVASKDEGFGLPIAEAMLYGVPCVMFHDIDAANDLASEEATVLVEERSDEALCAGIRQLTESRWDRQKIKDFAENFSMSKMAKAYHMLYESMQKDKE